MAKRDRTAICPTCGHLEVWHEDGACTVKVGILPVTPCPCEPSAAPAAALTPERQTSD